MKMFYLGYLTTTVALFVANGAFAGNEMYIDQVGSNHLINATQVGNANKIDAAQRNSDSRTGTQGQTANITQQGSNNQLRSEQYGTGSLSNVTVNGTGNKSVVSQGSPNNPGSGSESTGAYSSLNVHGVNNQAHMYNWGNGNKNSVNQVGQGNYYFADINNTGGALNDRSEVTVDMKGLNNSVVYGVDYATINSVADVRPVKNAYDTVSVNGADNRLQRYSELVPTGGKSILNASITGENNNVTVSQKSGSNQEAILISGRDNVINTVQDGTGNFAGITSLSANSTVNLGQNGVSNTANIGQFGTGHNAQVMQNGSGNVVNMAQKN